MFLSRTLIRNFARQRKLKETFGIGAFPGNERQGSDLGAGPLLCGLHENSEGDSNLVDGRDL